MPVHDDTVMEAARDWVEGHAERSYWDKIPDALRNRMRQNYEAAEATGWRIQCRDGHCCGVNDDKRWMEQNLEMFLMLHSPPRDEEGGSLLTFSLILEGPHQGLRVHRDMMGASGTVVMLSREMVRKSQLFGEARIPAEICTNKAVLWCFVLFNYTQVLFDGTDVARLGAVLSSGMLTPEQPHLPFDVWELYRLAVFMDCGSLVRTLESRACIDVWGNTWVRSQVLNQLNYILVKAEGEGSNAVESGLMQAAMGVAVSRTGSLNLLLRTPVSFSRATWEHWLELGTCREDGGGGKLNREREGLGLWSPLAYMFYARQFVDDDKVRDYLFGKLKEVSSRSAFEGFDLKFRSTLYFAEEKLHIPFANAPVINTYEGEYDWCTPVRCYKDSAVYGQALLAFQLTQLRVMTPANAPQWFKDIVKVNLDALIAGTPLEDPSVTEVQTLVLTAADRVELDFYSYEMLACMAEKRGLVPVRGRVVMDSSLVHCMSHAVRRGMLGHSLNMFVGKRRR